MPSYQSYAPIYYYHPDHLGSTSWVTDESGHEHQFLAYLPYGEPLLDMQFNSYDPRHGQDFARYKFTGKERDAETGYDYMEQRYYWNSGSFWARVDPLVDKYLNSSPYAYCNGNPLKYVDPNGEFAYKNEMGDYKWFDDQYTTASFKDEQGNNWTYVTDNQKKFNEAVTIRDAVIQGLSVLTNTSCDKLKQDVELFEQTSPLFTKEVKVVNPEKYICNWKDARNSDSNARKTSKTRQSPNIGNTGYALKYYQDKGNSWDVNAMGVVKSSKIGHIFEAFLEKMERVIFKTRADDDPLYDMHVRNAENLLQKR